MGSSPSAKLGWGIDLGNQEDWYGDSKYAALSDRFHIDELDAEDPGSFDDWAEKTLPALYVDMEARARELDAHGARMDEMIDAGRRAEYVTQREAIVAWYAAPVSHIAYGYEYGSHALILARSYAWAYDWGSVAVDPATVAPPTVEEIGHLRTAVESLGLTFDPEDVALILMAQYS